MEQDKYKFQILKTYKRFDLRIYNSEYRLQHHTYVDESVYKMSEEEQKKYIEENFKEVLDNI